MIEKVKIIIKNEKGIGLIEVLGALAISVIVITALVSMSVFTMRSSLNSRLLLEGTKYANTEIELVRAYRDRAANWQTFYDNLINSCNRDENSPDPPISNPCNISENDLSLLSDADGIKYSDPNLTPINGPEQVYINFNVADVDGSNQTLRIYVTARWTGGSAGSQKSTSVYTDLSNWQER